MYTDEQVAILNADKARRDAWLDARNKLVALLALENQRNVADGKIESALHTVLMHKITEWDLLGMSFDLN